MKNTTKIISEFFTIGSLTWEEACECALLYANKISDSNMIEEIIKIKTKDIRVPIENKSIEEVNQQLSLWN
jgi:hypothetical protein